MLKRIRITYDNLLEDIKPLVREYMKLRNLLKIAEAIRQIR